MKLPEHLALSFLFAQLGVHEQYGMGGTLLMLTAGCLPDLDGLSLLVGWRVYRIYHRVLGHGLPMTLAGPALLAAIGWGLCRLGPFWPLWGWLQLALLAHLATDILFYRWPVQLLWPFSSWAVGVGLVSWNDLVPTVMLYGAAVAAMFLPRLALAGIGGLVLYLGWRLWHPPPDSGWAAWLTGDWAPASARVWRWLTGDFVT
jgi:membrane-bound metal-dependent hydrolase YbcI (DUF457 family)